VQQWHGFCHWSDESCNRPTLIEFNPSIDGMGDVASQTNDQRLREIEATQRELKQSIEQSRELAAKSQKLLDRHRRELERDR
jgi:hypothetical protein